MDLPSSVISWTLTMELQSALLPPPLVLLQPLAPPICRRYDPASKDACAPVGGRCAR